MNEKPPYSTFIFDIKSFNFHPAGRILVLHMTSNIRATQKTFQIAFRERLKGNSDNQSRNFETRVSNRHRMDTVPQGLAFYSANQVGRFFVSFHLKMRPASAEHATTSRKPLPRYAG